MWPQTTKQFEWKFWLRSRLQVGQGVVLAIGRNLLLKLSSGRKRRLKFNKRRNVSFVGRYTKRYLRKIEKLNETSRNHVELGKGKELSSTDESIDDTDVEEAQSDLTTGLLCVITPKELDFRSILDSDAGVSLEHSETINGMTSDTVGDKYVNPLLNTEIEGTEELQRNNEGYIRHSITALVEREDPKTNGFNWEQRLTMSIRAKTLQNNVISFLWGHETNLEAEARKSIKCQLYSIHLSIAQVR